MNRISLEKGGPYMSLIWRLVKKNLKTLNCVHDCENRFPLM